MDINIISIIVTLIRDISDQVPVPETSRTLASTVVSKVQEFKFA